MVVIALPVTSCVTLAMSLSLPTPGPPSVSGKQAVGSHPYEGRISPGILCPGHHMPPGLPDTTAPATQLPELRSQQQWCIGGFIQLLCSFPFTALPQSTSKTPDVPLSNITSTHGQRAACRPCPAMRTTTLRYPPSTLSPSLTLHVRANFLPSSYP